VRHPTRAALVIFARAPQLGRVKTRLSPPLSPRQALAFHVACVESTARLAVALPGSIEKWLYWTRDTPAAHSLRLPSSLRFGQQRGSELGARIERAFRELHRAGAGRVVIIGTDCPLLTPQRLRRSFSLLARAQAVLGRARDGGFYLIGLRLPQRKLPKLFEGIEWGGPRVYRQVRRRLRAAGLRLALLPVSYDVDTVAELARLARDLRRSCGRRLAPLRAWLRQSGRA
jgi:rSAM/selenodomain-associated transferase 1